MDRLEINQKIAELQDEVLEELEDERFKHRKHYARATYADGCRGPLCTKAERDRARARKKLKMTRNRRAAPIDNEIGRLVNLYLENNGYEVKIAS